MKCNIKLAICLHFCTTYINNIFAEITVHAVCVASLLRLIYQKCPRREEGVKIRKVCSRDLWMAPKPKLMRVTRYTGDVTHTIEFYARHNTLCHSLKKPPAISNREFCFSNPSLNHISNDLKRRQPSFLAFILHSQGNPDG